ncbi:MAG TPA: LacI family DNA-binding transcriptional regulator [Propionibacteriaceae bacterium]|nr:LacI family DNA-binding transcriptional regulator [Propionibacteriaceae bacterium]
MTTIYDVAQRAGVSPATVSRVFNGTKVSAAKAAAVRDAAAFLGFVPNQNARRLRMGSSQIIAVLIPDIENSYFTALTRGVTDVARAAGYSVMLGNTDENPQLEAELVSAAIGDVAGIIVAPTSDTADYSLPISRGVPVVAVDRDAPMSQVDVVVADNVAGAIDATQRLFEMGFQRVACVSGPEHVMTADLRVEGWRKAWAQRFGTPPPEELCLRVPYTVDGGDEATAALMKLSDPPDAIFAGNNRIAVGAVRNLIGAGVDLTDFGVVSLGELPLTLYSPRGLVVTHLPARELGTRAAQMLLERINGYSEPPRREVLATVVTDDQHAFSMAPDRPSTTLTYTT